MTGCIRRLCERFITRDSRGSDPGSNLPERNVLRAWYPKPRPKPAVGLTLDWTHCGSGQFSGSGSQRFRRAPQGVSSVRLCRSHAPATRYSCDRHIVASTWRDRQGCLKEAVPAKPRHWCSRSGEWKESQKAPVLFDLSVRKCSTSWCIGADLSGGCERVD